MKIRNGFVSNSSSSAFIMPYDMFGGDMGIWVLTNLAVAFDEVKITENREVVVKYSGGRSLTEKIIKDIIPWSKQNYWFNQIQWTNIE